MKKLVLLPLLVVFIAAPAQILSEKNLEKARKNAELEIKNLPPKGWTSNRSDMSFEDMMQEAWKLKFAMYNDDVVYHIYTFGNGSGKTAESAYSSAVKKAKEQLPGLITLYFSSWNMTADIPDEEKDAINAAIGQAESQIQSGLEAWDLEPFVNMIRDRRGQKEVHVRYYYPQMEVREFARSLIMKELEKTTDWNKEKMIKRLTYEK